jgi:hypothetical protein
MQNAFLYFVATLLSLFMILLSLTRITQRVASMWELEARLVSGDWLRATSPMPSAVLAEEQRKTSK